MHRIIILGRASEDLREVIPLAESKPQPNHSQWNSSAFKEKLVANDVDDNHTETGMDGYLVHLRHNLECLKLGRIFPSHRAGKLTSDEHTGPIQNE